MEVGARARYRAGRTTESDRLSLVLESLPEHPPYAREGPPERVGTPAALGIDDDDAVERHLVDPGYHEALSGRDRQSGEGGVFGDELLAVSRDLPLAYGRARAKAETHTMRDRYYPGQTVQLGADDHGRVEGVVGEHDSEDTSWTTGEKGRRQARL